MNYLLDFYALYSGYFFLDLDLETLDETVTPQGGGKRVKVKGLDAEHALTSVETNDGLSLGRCWDDEELYCNFGLIVVVELLIELLPLMSPEGNAGVEVDETIDGNDGEVNDDLGDVVVAKREQFKY